MPLASGTTLGPYEIEAPLGAGGMGEVYKARDTRLDRTVAIKVMPEHVAADPDLKRRFEREAKTISSLNHPHICTLYDIGTQDGIDFLVMEYLDGETLARRLEKGALPLDQALAIAIEIADALDKAHRQGIVHRDLKPGNIMLTKAGAKLLDFGLARRTVVEGDQHGEATTLELGLTDAGVRLGTPGYMAPEQIPGGSVDGRSDLFSFGIFLREMLGGVHPFARGSPADTMAAIIRERPTSPSNLTESLTTLLAKLLAKEPDARPSSFDEVLTALAAPSPAVTASGRAAGERRVATVLVVSVSRASRDDGDDDDEEQLRASVNGGDPPAVPGRHPEFDSSGHGMRNSQS